LRGLHLLLTHKCNARCGHCFLNAGPEHGQVYSPEFGLKIIDQAGESASVKSLFIEGGEPFLYPDLLPPLVERAARLGLWTGVLSNGFWAHSEEKAIAALRPLADRGLRSLSLSTDWWHQQYVPKARVERAASAAKRLGLEVDVMVCLGGGKAQGKAEVEHWENGHQGAGAYEGEVVCRGRAATAVCSGGTRHWSSLTSCSEKLSDPSRVHVGPGGEIHLCQGLLIGERVETEPLHRVLDSYAAGEHPIVSKLIAGGPAALATFALDLGWEPVAGYADDCQLCFELRSFLRPRFPDFLGPGAVYPT
jgi:hypothetical protein